MPNTSKPTTARSGVFISYARSDGEDFANVLRQRLEAEGISLWQDRVGMEGGRDWWLQITEALDRVEFMALVITPNALKSDTVRKEWRYARQQGVCVYPIKGTPDLDFDSLPRWMRSAHFYDLEREWQKFVNDLNTRCQMRRVPFMVGDLPEGFVPRPGEFDQLLRLLLNERREEPVAITAALRGAGGYGKTTLAKALCHDERIQDAFDDGILWVTLGEKLSDNLGDLTGRVEDLIVTLGDERPGFTTLDAAINRLKELLADRDILIVIDDVWDRAHLNPFIHGGPRCGRLITTRNLDTLPASAEKVKVDAMQEKEATALLAAGLDQVDPDDSGLTRELKTLASRLGEWPLLLRLVKGALRNRIENDRQSPRDALSWVNSALTRRGLTYFDARNSKHREQAVRSTIEVSLDLLSVEERKRYSELAIFPEDVEIPVATLERLWRKTGGFDEFDTEELCSRLNRFSLLWSYDANRRHIRIHDVIRKFLIGEQPTKLSSIHAQLLDVHRPALPATWRPRWAEMPRDEHYLWDHLAYHIIEAGHGNELVATVEDWRYLVAKTLIRKSLTVEGDLLVAEKIANNAEPLRLLRRNFVNSGHLLNRCETRNDVEVTLFSRLQHLEGLRWLTSDLEQRLKRPCLLPASKLPDLPHPALVRTLSGHAGVVRSCGVSADGAIIASASADKTLKVWDARSGAEHFTLRGHAGWVFGCAVSADGATIISSSWDGTLKAWDGRSGAERFTLRGHARAVFGCAISADGTTIVSASADKTLKVWDGRLGVARFTLRGHKGGVFGCAVSADGVTIVSASVDKTLKVWDGRSGLERFTLRGHEDGVNHCALSDDGVIIVSASNDGTLKVWDARNGAECFTLIGHAGGVFGCTLSADGKTIISASDDQTLKVWDGTSGTERYTLSGHTGVVRGCAASPDGAIIISASDDGTLNVWDGLSRSTSRELEPFIVSGHVGRMRHCAVSADATTVVSASDDGTLKVWNGRRLASRTEHFTIGHRLGGDRGCAVSGDGGTIITASVFSPVRVWNSSNGAERVKLSDHASVVSGCAISPDGATIVAACDDGTLKVWDGWSGLERFTLNGHAGRVNSCAVSADGATIVSASADKTMRVWDARSGLERFTLSGHASGVNGSAVSSDGTTIISASDDTTLKVWDGKNGVERFTLRGHSGCVNGCAVTADGATIISACGDQTLKVWAGRTGECLSTLHVDGPLYGCSSSANGDVIAATGACGIYFLRLVR